MTLWQQNILIIIIIIFFFMKIIWLEKLINVYFMIRYVDEQRTSFIL